MMAKRKPRYGKSISTANLPLAIMAGARCMKCHRDIQDDQGKVRITCQDGIHRYLCSHCTQTQDQTQAQKTPQQLTLGL